MLTFEFVETSRPPHDPIQPACSRHQAYLFILKYNFGNLPNIRIKGVSVAVSMVLFFVSREEVTRWYIREDRGTSFVYFFPSAWGEMLGRTWFLFI